MRIIDKLYDYYDYLQDHTDTLVFDRRNSYVVTKDDILRTLSVSWDNYLMLQCGATYWLFYVDITKKSQDNYWTDTWAADIVLEMKKENADIKLICAIPFRGVERNRSPELQAKFHEILKSADGAEYMSEKYKRWVFLARDRWMVDHSSYVIAVYNGSKGGTEFTVDYARKKGKRIVFVNLETEDDIGR